MSILHILQNSSGTWRIYIFDIKPGHNMPQQHCTIYILQSWLYTMNITVSQQLLLLQDQEWIFLLSKYRPDSTVDQNQKKGVNNKWSCTAQRLKKISIFLEIFLNENSEGSYLEHIYMLENYYLKHFFSFYPHYVIIPPLNKTNPLLSARLLWLSVIIRRRELYFGQMLATPFFSEP